MSWKDSLLRAIGRHEPIVMPEVTGRIPNERVDFHIRRFTLAVEQCEKGPERLAVLQANLDYWKAIKAARAMLSEGGG